MTPAIRFDMWWRRGRLSRERDPQRGSHARQPRVGPERGGRVGVPEREPERGAALVTAVMATLLLTALGLALILTTTTETRIAANYRGAHETMYAADAGIERALQDLLTVPDWNNILAGTTKSAFIDGPSNTSRNLPDGSVLNLTEATNMANCGKITTCTAAEMDALTEERPWGTNNPRWVLYAHGPVNDMVPTGTINSNIYVIVWVGDDQSENDNDPLKDGSTSTNPGTGVLALRAEAFGPSGSHKIIEIAVARTNTQEIERGYVGQRGQDEQNRRARKAAVQLTGAGLARQELTTTTGVIQ